MPKRSGNTIVMAYGYRVSDLGFTEGMPLEVIYLPSSPITNGIDYLKNLKTLKGVDGVPKEIFWTR